SDISQTAPELLTRFGFRWLGTGRRPGVSRGWDKHRLLGCCLLSRYLHPQAASLFPTMTRLAPQAALVIFDSRARHAEKRKLGGSTPPLITRQLATCGLVTRPNVIGCLICSTPPVAAAARLRPLFAVRWGTRRARRVILSMRSA